MYGEDKKDEIVQLYLDDIIPNRFQPREVFDERALKELAVSIKEHGVIQPIIVRNVNGKYEIIAGERRYKASALAGQTKIPAIIRDLDDKESSKVALLENLQRKNLNAIEEARTFQKILELDEMTQEELAKTMGKSQSAVANKLRLLNLPDEVQDALLKDQISERHARALLNVPDQNGQKDLLNKVITEKISVRKLEEEIAELYPKPKKAEEIPVEKTETTSTNEYLNDKPLVPTSVDINEEEDNYGKVIISPPKEEQDEMNDNPEPQVDQQEEPNNNPDEINNNPDEMNDQPEEQNYNEEQPNNEEPEENMEDGKFINYGEIGKERNEPEETAPNGFELPENPMEVDVDKIREQSGDLNENNDIPKSDIDGMLNLTAGPITPAEEIVKETTTPEPQEEKSDDYFNQADLESVPIPSIENQISIDDEPNNEEPEENVEEPINPLITIEPENEANQEEGELLIDNNAEPTDKYTVDDATQKIRDLLQDLRSHGVEVNADEMNFPKSYQIIIKIDKEQ